MVLFVWALSKGEYYMTSYQISLDVGCPYILCSKQEYVEFLGLDGEDREEYFNMLAQTRPCYREVDE